MTKIKRGVALLATIGAVSLATPAAAQFVYDPVTGSLSVNSGTAVGTTYTMNFNGQSGGVVVPGLSSVLLLTYQGLVGTDNDDMRFTYSFQNTSTVGSTLTGLGFDVAPILVLGQTFASGVFPVIEGDLVTTNGGNIAGYSLDLCFTTGGGNTCGGNTTANAGIDMGQTGSGAFTLGFSGVPQQVTLTNILARYQDVAAPGVNSAIGVPVPGVPEPATWAMMILGFGLAGSAMRRRRAVMPRVFA